MYTYMRACDVYYVVSEVYSQVSTNIVYIYTYAEYRIRAIVDMQYSIKQKVRVY